MSLGKRIRNEGNKHFSSAMGMLESNPAKSVQFFALAISSYKTALQNVDPVHNDFASCSKNLGISYFRMGSVLYDLESRGTGEPLPSAPSSRNALQEALAHVSSALRAGQNSKSEAWMAALCEEHQQLSDLVLETLLCKPRDERIQVLRKLSSVWSLAHLPRLWYTVAQAHFFIGVAHQQAADFVKSANEFQHTQQAALRGMELYPDVETKQDLTELLEGTSINSCHAEREFLIRNGNAKMHKALLEEEVLDVESLWDALDDFKQVALLAARDLHPLHEAIASCRIGVIFFKCFKLTQPARKYFQNSIQLAISLQPTDVSAEHWYKEAVECEQAIQASTVQQEAKEEHERRGKYMDVLQPLFDRLEAKKKLPFDDFMEFLKTNFPPPRPSTAAAESAPPSAKKILLSAIRAYHPDKHKHGGDDESRKQFYLYEHITKILNEIYCNSDKGATLSGGLPEEKEGSEDEDVDMEEEEEDSESDDADDHGKRGTAGMQV